jgi:hypothetical protein
VGDVFNEENHPLFIAEQPLESDVLPSFDIVEKFVHDIWKFGGLAGQALVMSVVCLFFLIFVGFICYLLLVFVIFKDIFGSSFGCFEVKIDSNNMEKDNIDLFNSWCKSVGRISCLECRYSFISIFAPFCYFISFFFLLRSSSDFLDMFPGTNAKDIGQLEKRLLSLLNFNVIIKSKQYVETYFNLRASLGMTDTFQELTPLDKEGEARLEVFLN